MAWPLTRRLVAGECGSQSQRAEIAAVAPSAIALRLSGSEAKILVCDEPQQDKLTASEDIPANAPFRVVATAVSDRLPQGPVRLADLLAPNKPGMPVVSLGGGAPIIQICTSGTTGRPKGVVVPTKALKNPMLMPNSAWICESMACFGVRRALTGVTASAQVFWLRLRPVRPGFSCREAPMQS